MGVSGGGSPAPHRVLVVEELHAAGLGGLWGVPRTPQGLGGSLGGLWGVPGGVSERILRTPENLEVSGESRGGDSRTPHGGALGSLSEVSRGGLWGGRFSRTPQVLGVSGASPGPHRIWGGGSQESLGGSLGGPQEPTGSGGGSLRDFWGGSLGGPQDPTGSEGVSRGSLGPPPPAGRSLSQVFFGVPGWRRGLGSGWGSLLCLLGGAGCGAPPG